MNKSLKDCTDEEVLETVKKAIQQIRGTPNQYGVVKIEMSGGKVKFIRIELPFDEP